MAETIQHHIDAASTSTAAFVGWTPKGHTDRAVEVDSLREFVEEFGDLDARSLLGHAVRWFFENGGSQAWVVRLSGGVDAVVAPNTEPFERLVLPASGSGGAYLLDRVRVNLLCVPGETTASVIAALQAFCVARRIFLIADAPQAAMPFVPDPRVTGEAAQNAAMYLPWMLPADAGTGTIHALPPSGFVAGVFARTDRTRGVWKSPAGVEATLVGATGPALPVTDRDVAALAEHGVNAIRSFADHTVVWGSRTLAGGITSESDFKYVAVRRLAIFIEDSVEQGLSWAVFEPNGEALWAQVRLSVSDFLLNLFHQGAFPGTTPAQAYFVKCGVDTMTADDIARGDLRIVIGFAPLKPAEFVVLRFSTKAAQSTVE